MRGLTPLSASTAADPYPYYDRLVLERPFHFDSAIGMWVASSAAVVEAILSHPGMRVRPLDEPVPKPLEGTPVGAVFSQFARMTDGARHHVAKAQATALALSEHFQDFQNAVESCCDRLTQKPDVHVQFLEQFVRTLPAMSIAVALGCSPDDALAVAEHAGSFARAIAPGASAADIERGIAATQTLQSTLSSLFGNHEPVFLSNALGLLFQSYDATAGLIGNTLVALAHELCADADDETVEEVARYDSPVHNTRRFAALDVTIEGMQLHKGDAVLVLLAAANRDAAANPQPHRFIPGRSNRRLYTFGTGVHACPGARVACTIAGIGVRRVVAHGLDLAAIKTVAYRPLSNVRVPDFSGAKAPSSRS